MNVLITGGAGFVGTHLAQSLLADGHRLTIVDNFQRGVRDSAFGAVADHPATTIVDADLMSPNLADVVATDFDAIVHLAAIIGVRHVLERPYSVLADNTVMTMNVIEVGRRQRHLEHVVFSSTSEIYAGSLIHLPMMAIPTPESTPLALTDLAAPRTSYMLSKAYGEALFHHSGLPATSIRLHNIYGPRMGMSHVIPELLLKAHNAKDGDELTVASIGHRRTFCFVSDAVAMIRAILESSETIGVTLNIGNSSPEVTIGELAQTIVDVVGRSMTIVAGPETPGSPVRRCPDVSLLQRLTGVSGVVGLEEGVRKTYEWYRDHTFTGSEISAT
jgi:nucleoside-diphosphate-sugar epimerase